MTLVPETIKMAYPVSHKTVFVLDHSPNFSMACDVVDCDSLKTSMQAAARQIPITPVYKTMWTSMSESILEYCRIVWDIFPPDCQEQKLIRFVLSGSDTQVLNRWDNRDQTVEVLKNAYVNIVDQMAEQILRTCYSFVIYSRDFSSALCDPTGDTVADGDMCAGDIIDGGEDSCQGDSGGRILNCENYDQQIQYIFNVFL